MTLLQHCFHLNLGIAKGNYMFFLDPTYTDKIVTELSKWFVFVFDCK